MAFQELAQSFLVDKNLVQFAKGSILKGVNAFKVSKPIVVELTNSDRASVSSDIEDERAGFLIFEQSDYTDETKRTIGDYLHQETIDNRYVVAPGSNESDVGDALPGMLGTLGQTNAITTFSTETAATTRGGFLALNHFFGKGSLTYNKLVGSNPFNASIGFTIINELGGISANSTFFIGEKLLDRGINQLILNHIDRQNYQKLKFRPINGQRRGNSIEHPFRAELVDGKVEYESYDSATSDVITNNNISDNIGNNINPAALHKKHRLSDRVNKNKRSLAWASNTVPSKYILPESIVKTDILLNGKKKSTLGLTKRRGFHTPTNSNRFSAEDVETYEDLLDAYYMPFYFQDLRTNEFVSFHAFLEDMGDSYNADYVETEGFGRLGSIYAFRNTKRSINVSFKVVATNPEDFDEMWYKINRFIMMIHPQYTLGRILETESGEKFIQPMSQLISSTPLVRMRVGDLFKSNYSHFDAARLFGVGSEHFSLTSEQSVTEEGTNDTLQRKIDSVRNRMESGQFNPTERFKIRSTTDIEFSLNVEQQLNQTIRNSTSPLAPDVNLNRLEGKVATVVEQVQRQPLQEENIPTEANNLQGVVGAGNSIENGNIIATYRVTVEGEGQPFVVRLRNDTHLSNQISIVDDFVIDAAQRELGTVTESSNQQQSANVRAFLDPTTGDNSNPVIRGFESAKGQGLAGVIRSLKLDWSGATWETEGLNNRAPKLITIGVEFAPINDINPGLDSNGFMIGGLYNVGQIMRRLKQQRQQNRDNRQNLRESQSEGEMTESSPPSQTEDAENARSIVG